MLANILKSSRDESSSSSSIESFINKHFKDNKDNSALTKLSAPIIEMYHWILKNMGEAPLIYPSQSSFRFQSNETLHSSGLLAHLYIHRY